MRDQPAPAPWHIRWTVGVLVISAALSVPAIVFAAWWFNNGDLLAWLVLPFILFMAG